MASSNTSYDVQKAMEQLENVREYMGDGAYVNLANSLMDLYKRTREYRESSPSDVIVVRGGDRVSRDDYVAMREVCRDVVSKYFYHLHFHPSVEGQSTDTLLATILREYDDECRERRVASSYEMFRDQVLGVRFGLEWVLRFKSAIYKMGKMTEEEAKEKKLNYIKNTTLKSARGRNKYKVWVVLGSDEEKEAETSFIRLGGKYVRDYTAVNRLCKDFMDKVESEPSGNTLNAFRLINSQNWRFDEEDLLYYVDELKLLRGNTGTTRNVDYHREYFCSGVRVKYMDL